MAGFIQTVFDTIKANLPPNTPFYLGPLEQEKKAPAIVMLPSVERVQPGEVVRTPEGKTERQDAQRVLTVEFHCLGTSYGDCEALAMSVLFAVVNGGLRRELTGAGIAWQGGLQNGKLAPIAVFTLPLVGASYEASTWATVQHIIQTAGFAPLEGP